MFKSRARSSTEWLNDFRTRICVFSRMKDKATLITPCRIKGTAQTKVAACHGIGQLHLLRNLITGDNICFEEVVKRMCLVHEALLS